MNYTGAAVGAFAAYLITSAVGSIAPVTFGMDATDVRYDGGAYQAKIEGRKIQDCQVVPGSFIGWYYADGLWIETAFRFIDDPSPNSSNPSGFERQSFGIWRWEDLPAEAVSVRMTLNHNCGGDLRVTTVGPFELLGE